jgi:hypothetical protein
MPNKRNKKSGKKSGKGGNSDVGSDEDGVFSDNVSVASVASNGSYMKDEAAVQDETEELNQNEIFEDKLREVIDQATSKSTNVRIQSLTSLTSALTKKYVPDFLETQYKTIVDILEKALKRGKGTEQVIAANCCILLCLGLGPSSSSEEVYKLLKTTFQTVMMDASANPAARAAAANALGSCCFLAGGEIAEFITVMDDLEKIFKLSYSRKNNDLSSEILALHTSALSAWTLLLTMVPPSHAYSMLASHMDHLGHLLDSPDVDLRITAGEAIVILFENAADHDEDEAYDSVMELTPKIKELATDSNKHRSKKDRKEQRSSFRDILKTIQDGKGYSEKISINSREILILNDWFMKKHYDSLCKVLLSGINLHLTENELVRDVFELGPPIPALSALQSSRPSKHERQLVNSQAFKVRTQTRGKERDKRSAIL